MRQQPPMVRVGNGNERAVCMQGTGQFAHVFWPQSLGTTLPPRENSIYTTSRPIGLPQIRNPNEQGIFNLYLEARASGVRGPRSTGKDAACRLFDVLRYYGGKCFLQTLRKTEEIRNHNISVTLAPSRSKLLYSDLSRLAFATDSSWSSINRNA
jgi:hypothetical protein